MNRDFLLHCGSLLFVLAAAAPLASCDEGVGREVGSLMEALTGETCEPGNAAGVVSPVRKAMLDTIAWAEGTRGAGKDGYNVAFTFRFFSRCDAHPNLSICSGSLCSTAAGRYQFLTGTWNGLGLPNFWPENQERGAMALVGRRGVSLPEHEPLSATAFASAMDKLSWEWASLPPSRYGQGGKTLDALWTLYRDLAGSDAVGNDGCTAVERSNAAKFGCVCVDHHASGGFCEGTGCTAVESDNCGKFGCGCVDHKCSGGFCENSGCTALEITNCGKFGCNCVDHKCSGGFCADSGCTALEITNCGKFGCNCVDHECSGGFCEGTGCTALETNNCAQFGCECSDHKCAGGFCEDAAAAKCAGGNWTIVAVDGADTYGTHTFAVPAAQNWVNTGLFLRAGQQARLTETGSWAINNDETPAIDHGPCIVGQLVARIGLHYKDANLTCVEGETAFTADKDGILFVGALAGNDLAETYESRHESTGAKTVTVTSDGATAPTFDGASLTPSQLSAVRGDFVEVTGRHVILTLPTATARADVATIGAAIERLDTIYELHEELRGARPQCGQRLRFFPDGTQTLGYMLAGNPIRMVLSLVAIDDANRITRAGESGTDVWGFAHEMGHDFSFVNRVWQYEDNSLESWPNVFTVHALTTLGVPLLAPAAECNAGSSGSYTTWDAFGGLCFLLQFQYRYGWDFYATFFRALNGYSHSQVPGGPQGWYFVHDLFEQTSGQDVTPLFVAWDVPNPG